MLDLAIIGGGPAALSAAIYAARAGVKVQIFEKADFGGTLPEISRIENYPGFLGAGRELADSMRSQAEQAGAVLSYGECTSVEVISPQSATDLVAPVTSNHISTMAPVLQLMIDGELVQTRAVLVASGSEPRKLPFHLQIPASYCALCDGPLVKGKNVVVVGGANSAVQESLFLSNLAAKVTIITHSRLKADQELLDRLPRSSNITIIENTEPTPEFLEQFDHCFVYIGKNPATKFLPAAILDASGYVKCRNQGHFPHQTSLQGVFAAGDVCENSVKQVVTAAGDGAAAAIEITNYLKS